MAQPEVEIPEGWEDAGPVSDAGVAIPEGWEDAGPVPEAPAPEAGPAPMSNVELAQRTRGPTVPIGNGQSMLRSAITTDVAPGGVGFTSSGAKVLGSAFTVTQGNVDPEVTDETAVRNAKLMRAFELAKSKDGPKLGKAVEISRAFNVPVRQVLPNLPEFERAAEQAKFDPAEFYEKNKLLADVMMDSPETMAAVVVDPNVPALVQAFRAVKDLGVFDAVEEATGYVMSPVKAPVMLVEKAKRLWSLAHGVDVEAADAQAKADEVAAEQKRRNAKETKFDSPEAKAIRESNGIERTALTLQRRYREARAATDMTNAGAGLAMAEAREELGIGDAQATAEAARRVQDARAASRPLLLGEEGATQFVGDNLQALISTFDTALGSVKGLAGGAALGAVAGAAAGAAVTKSAPGAVAGAKEGAKLGAEKGRTVGGVLAAFNAEFGGKYLDLRDAVTDEGQKLSRLEALGGAAAYGVVAAYLENLGTEAQLAPGADALKAQVRKLLTSDPLFRRRVANLGKAWAEGALTEGVTEALQSTADQVVEYAAKSLKDERLQRGPMYNPEQALIEGQAGLFGGGVVTGAGTVASTALEAVSASRAAVTSPSQVAIIASLAEQAPVKGAPAEFAEVVRRATAETGAPVREFWVEAGELARLNQESGKTEEQLALELGEAAGPEAVQAYKAAVAEGGRFPVAIEKVLSTWATSPMGQALLEHTATSETAPTGAQLKASDTAQLQAIQQHALEMAQKAMEAQADEEGFDDALAQMQRDIVDAGRSGREARDAVRVIRAFYETAKADNPSLTWKGVLEAAGRLEFAEGDNGESKVRVKAMQPFDDLRSLIDFGPKGDAPLSVPQKAELLYRDDVTGLRNEEAWKLEGVPEGYMVAQLTTPDAKAINDNPEGSHDSTNELLLRMAAVVAKTDPKAARAGTNFWVRVKDQAALDALVAELRAVMPEGMQAFGAAASTREQAGRALDKVVDDARKAGVTVPRGQTAFKGKPSGFAEGVAKVATPLEGVHESEVGPDGKFESREAFGNQAFRDPEVPGLLTRLGFLNSKPAKFVASLDLRGIRDTNIEMGKRAGDALLRYFSNRLVAMGGHAFAAAHMSGDEYAMKSDSKEALIEMLSDLRDDLENSPVTVEAEELDATSKAELEKLAGTMGLKTKGTLTIDGVAMPFEGRAAFEALIDPLTSGSVDAVVSFDAQLLTPARFRFGIGEGTYGKADRDLNTRKQLEAQAENGGGVPARRTEGDDLRERRSAVEERRARAQYRGGPAANPFVDVAEGQADELSFDPGGAAGDSRGGSGRVGPHTSVEDAVSRPAGEPLVDPETLAQFRENVSKMRATKRRARLQAFLSYIEGTAPRPKDPADGSTVAGLTRDDQQAVLKAYGIDDPLGTFLSNRQLGLPNNPKRDPTKKRGDFASPHAKDETNLKLLRGEKLFYQQDVAGVAQPLDLQPGDVKLAEDNDPKGYQVVDVGAALYGGSTVAVVGKSSPLAAMVEPARKVAALPEETREVEWQGESTQMTATEYARNHARELERRRDGPMVTLDEVMAEVARVFEKDNPRWAADKLLATMALAEVLGPINADEVAEVMAMQPVSVDEIGDLQNPLTGVTDQWEDAETGRALLAQVQRQVQAAIDSGEVAIRAPGAAMLTKPDELRRLAGIPTVGVTTKRNVDVSSDGKQTLSVWLDQFESQTGRLNQSGVQPSTELRTFDDGRVLLSLPEQSGESAFALVPFSLGKIEQALQRAKKQWTGKSDEAERAEWDEIEWKAARNRAFRHLDDAVRALKDSGDGASAVRSSKSASRVERELGDDPFTSPVTALIEKYSEALDEDRFTLTEARTGDWAARQDLMVALDEYEASTGRMRQDEANMASTPRGYFIRPPPGAEGVARVLKVFLNKKADASTVMHEAAHGFLEMLHNLASTEGAGLRTKQQWADALKWLGVESYAEIKREHHERWARAFEAYLREGKGPSNALFSVFNRFKAWLTRIYKSVTQLNVELDENVKRIFDRMLATDEEIMRANGKRGAGPWSTAEEAGMTPEQFREYQEANREALAFATREAAARFTRQALDDAEKDWKEQVDAARADAVAEYEALPARKAQRFLEGKAQDLLDAGVSMAPVVLDREAVERAVGASGVKKFRTRRGGANPDEAAQLNGYPTGPDMLRAITQLPAMDKWVEQRAQALAEERDAAGAAELARLRKEVEGGVQKYVEERMAREWKELGRRAEPGSDVSELGRQVALATLKRAGALIVERQRVGTLSTSKVLARERAASVKVRNAARTGNLDAARDWFREQSLQAYAHGATIEAIKERDRFEKMASGLTETAARARLGKASPALRDAVDYLLGAFGLGEPTDFTGETLQAAAAVLEESGGIPGDWFEALQMPELVRVGDWRNLSVANLRHLDAALRQLTAEARFRNEVMLGEKKAEREAVVEQLVTEAREVLPAKTPPGTRSSDTVIDTLSSFANKASGWLLNPADLVRDLTSDNLDSTWWKAIIEPLRLAKYREAEFLKRAVEPVIAAIEALPESAKKTMRDAVDGKRLFPNHIESLLPPRQRYELLMMALNAGNEGNLQRLTDGRRITVEEVARALDTLTDDELKWVESVWDAVSTLKEDAFALEERETGLRPRGVDPVPFRLPSGRVLKGGYFPAVYDARASLMGEKQQIESVAATVATNYTRPGTSHGYVKQRAARVEDAAISLDLGVIYRHLAQVAHDVAQREAVKSVASLVLDKRVQSVMRERLGDGKTSTFLKWLRDVGGATGADTTPFDGLIRYSRSTFSHIILGWKAATALGDFANLPAAVATTPLTTKHLTAALRDFWSNPFTAREKALKASPWLRTMKDKTREQYDTAMRNMLQKGLPKPLQWYKDMSFFFMETVSVLTATPVWMGAHQQAVSEGRTQEDAVKFADDILSRVFPSHAPVDQAGILRDKGLIGLSTVMYGYLSVAYRAQHRLIMPLFEQEFLNAPAGQKAATVGTVAGRLLGFYVAYSVLGELLMGRGPEAGDDDEEEPGNHALRWRNWFMRKLIAGPLATVPVYDFARAFEAAATGKPAPSARSTPLASVAELLSKEIRTVFNSEKSSPERVYALAKLPLEGMGISFVPFDTQGKWLIDVALGNVQVNGPGDVASGLIYGQRKDQPANIFKPVRE